MTETVLDETDLPEIERRPLRLDWLLPLFFRPGRTLRAVTESESPTWLAPVLLLSLLAIVYTLVAGPLRIQQALSTPPQLPSDFQFYPPEQQQKFLEANQPNTSPVMMYVLPGLSALVGVWAGWFLLGAVLHLALTLSGGRGSRTADFSLAAWASLPFGLRSLVQIATMLFGRQLIAHPGLSGFFPSGASGFSAYLAVLCGLVDLYLVWQIALLVAGASLGARLPKMRAAGAVLASVLILLALQALPAFLLGQLSGLSVQRPFFF
jgi:hypothetical protein